MKPRLMNHASAPPSHRPAIEQPHWTVRRITRARKAMPIRPGESDDPPGDS